MSQSSRLNISSLIDLKAELCKKKEEFAASAVEKKYKKKEFATGHARQIFKRSPDLQLTKAPSSSYEQELLDKSAKVLENKSRLYRQLERGDIDASKLSTIQRENLLVDFGVKEISGSTDDDLMTESGSDSDYSSVSGSHSDSDTVEWIEFKDEFGRERLIKQSEFLAIQNERKQIHQLLNPEFEPLHYTEDYEIRNKGVAFFRFASNEKERHAQQRQLNELRQQTDEGRLKALFVREERRLKLEQRLQRRCRQLK